MTLIVPHSLAERLQQTAQQRGLEPHVLLEQLLDSSLDKLNIPADGMLNEGRFRSMLESQIDLICRYTPDTILTYVNHAYCAFFGRTPQELIGTSFLPFTLPEYESSIRARIVELAHDPSPRMREYKTLNALGEDTYLLWVDLGIMDADGTLLEVQAVGRDITERRQLDEQRMVSQALQIELAKEREMIEMKAQMISTLSHEFRTPLSVIQTSLDILERYMTRLSHEQIIDRFHIIRGQIKTMVALMEDMLVFGRMESGRTTVEREPIDVAMLCLRLCDDLLVSDMNRHNLRFDAAPGVETVLTDKSLFERIVINLTSNAFKYSPQHTTVKLSLNMDGTSLVLRVADEGIGIPEEDRANLFQPFFRASNVGRVAGTGLGLSIVKQSVDLLGGTVMYSTSQGKGSTFTVVLPGV